MTTLTEKKAIKMTSLLIVTLSDLGMSKQSIAEMFLTAGCQMLGLLHADADVDGEVEAEIDKIVELISNR